MTLRTTYSKDELRLLANFLRNFTLGMIKPLKPNHIIYYAQKNLIVDPRKYIYSLPEDVLYKIRKIVRENPQLIGKYINYEVVIRELEKDRPDLTQVLTNIEYQRWFNRFINIFRKIVLNI